MIHPAMSRKRSTTNRTPSLNAFPMSPQMRLKKPRMSPQMRLMNAQISLWYFTISPATPKISGHHCFAKLRMSPHARFRKLKMSRSEEHTSELQSPDHLVCRLLLEKQKSTRLNSSHSH